MKININLVDIKQYDWGENDLGNRIWINDI